MITPPIKIVKKENNIIKRGGRTLAAYSLETALQKWEKGELSTEQAVGQTLLIVQELAERVGRLERRAVGERPLPETRPSPKPALEQRPSPEQPPMEEPSQESTGL
jgi:hypothetical protein